MESIVPGKAVDVSRNALPNTRGAEIAYPVGTASRDGTVPMEGVAEKYVCRSPR